jgi:hypothetical protein
VSVTCDESPRTATPVGVEPNGWGPASALVIPHTTSDVAENAATENHALRRPVVLLALRRSTACDRSVRCMELPDFHIPHAEKIEWMIETNGWALEPVAPDAERSPPTPAYAYTIGVPALTGWAEVAVFGLTPVAANGLVGLVVDALLGGTEIPTGVELVGLLDNELRCYFAPIHPDVTGTWFHTAHAWYRGGPFDMVQLLFPDRNGFMPYETGFDQRMRLAQPVVGLVS